MQEGLVKKKTEKLKRSDPRIIQVSLLPQREDEKYKTILNFWHNFQHQKLSSHGEQSYYFRVPSGSRPPFSFSSSSSSVLIMKKKKVYPCRGGHAKLKREQGKVCFQNSTTSSTFLSRNNQGCAKP